MGFFDYERIAEGYAHSRPQYHTIVMEMLRETLGDKELKNGLDLGCGAGLSTTALRKICGHVVGADGSAAMINKAKQVVTDAQTEFILSSAEELDFPEDSFDIITIAGAINWIDEKVFLPIARKILRPDGILLIYDNFMSDRMEGQELYTDWWYNEYLQKFPKPARKEHVWEESDVAPYGFTTVSQRNYSNILEMSKSEYIAYMLTQSNVVAQVEQGNGSLGDVKEWFELSLDKVFGNQRRSLIFEGYVWHFRRKQ